MFVNRSNHLNYVAYMEIFITRPQTGKQTMTEETTQPIVPQLDNVVTSLVVAVAPLVLNFSSESIGERLLLSVCGLLGASLALFTDRPINWKDTAARVGSGVFSSFLFGPYLCRKLGYYGQIDSTIMVYGVMGLLSWYIMGSAMRFIKQIQTSDLIERIFRAKFSLPDFKTLEQMPNNPTLVPPPQPPEKIVQEATKANAELVKVVVTGGDNSTIKQ